MNTHLPQFRFVLMMLCIAMLVLRLGGAHMHLCLDGSEPPSTIHYEDHAPDQEHADAHEQTGHYDLNIEVSDSTLVKKTNTGMNLLALLLAVALLLLPHDNFIKLARRFETAPSIHDLFHLRPPLRGPPSPLPFASFKY